MTFRSKVLAHTKKDDGRTERRTDGYPKPIGPQPFGLVPKNTKVLTTHHLVTNDVFKDKIMMQIGLLYWHSEKKTVITYFNIV